MTDGELALAILTNIACDPFSAIITEVDADGGMFIVDSSWVDGTPGEMDLLRRLKAEHDCDGDG